MPTKSDQSAAVPIHAAQCGDPSAQRPVPMIARKAMPIVQTEMTCAP